MTLRIVIKIDEKYYWWKGVYLTTHWKFTNEIKNIAPEIVVEQRNLFCIFAICSQ